MDYRDWPPCRPHKPRAERMTEKVEVTPSAMERPVPEKDSAGVGDPAADKSRSPHVDDKDAQPTDRPEEHDHVSQSPFPEHQCSVQPDDQDEHSTEA